MAERFVELLTGRPDTIVVLQCFDDSKVRADPKLARALVGTVKQHAAMLSKANDNGCGIFIQINEGLRRGAKHITGARALFVDDDHIPLEERLAKGEAPCSRCEQFHSSELPPLLTCPPTIAVQSSFDERNMHYYWRIKSGMSLADWSDAQVRLACALKTDSSMKNIDRVMRLPGTMNRKHDPKRGRDGTPFKVVIK